MGGPLIQGDIEDYMGSVVVVECPWHHYKILAHSGEGIYKDLNGDIRHKGKRQRVHPVRIENNESVFVQVVWPDKKELPSDDYQPKTDEEKRRMGLLPRNPK